MLKYKFLGVNNSLQEVKSGNTSLLIGSDGTHLLIDTSVNIAEAVDFDVDAVLFTHEHIDHLYALPSLLHQMWLMKRKRQLNIYCHIGMNEIVNNLIDIFGIRGKKDIFPIAINNDDELKIGDIFVEAVKSNHTEYSRSYVFRYAGKKLVYTSDTRPFAYAPQSFMDADVLIHEAGGTDLEREKLIDGGHSTAGDAATLAKKTNAKKLLLCHLPVGDNVKLHIKKTAIKIFKDTNLADVNSWVCL
ncbi:MBL fold metallo-hydrolase [Amygdalobacter nucleatus]|uniref:Metallo-beta-lactamase domain protein n=1 Tax=Amygdalobacter nucleatus TaxID=3029274 RepID=A0A133YHQ6_9FIRM|nr:MBL fold metallo-hydrolase [Amygdalobacter nucleatus]KXB42719.1 metallo-beta-lactamase domain protein [Amygdalobacter nucleatus]MDF0486217.1 MBL fold metallo-hydrolase [Amygdalobacter nucleatus]